MMSFTEQAYRALRVGLLIFALAAALYPATQYSARRDLLNRVAQPAAAADQTTQPSRAFWSESKNSFALVVNAKTAPLTNRQLKRQTSVYATVPTYQEALLCAGDQTLRIYAEYEPFHYVSCCVTQPADRGPPTPV